MILLSSIVGDFLYKIEVLVDLSDCCWHVNHVRKLLKQAIQDADKEKADIGLSQVT